MSGGRQSLSGTTALGTGTRKLDNALRKLSVANAFNKKARAAPKETQFGGKAHGMATLRMGA